MEWEIGPCARLGMVQGANMVVVRSASLTRWVVLEVCSHDRRRRTS